MRLTPKLQVRGIFIIPLSSLSSPFQYVRYHKNTFPTRFTKTSILLSTPYASCRDKTTGIYYPFRQVTPVR